jgi:hypothetical protein
MLALNMYNKLALITGFPEYTNDTDTPETTRFLLECLSQGLQNVINNIYMQNNVLERTDTITTTKDKELYGIEGIIKQIHLVRNDGSLRQLAYLDNVNPNIILEGVNKKTGEPHGYCISKGYLRIFPIPDGPHRLSVTVSTTDLVWANDDSSKRGITSVNDTVMADPRFCDLCVLRAAVLVFARAKNANAELYNNLYKDELNDYLEHDLKTLEANRFFDRSAGHYSPRRGLID